MNSTFTIKRSYQLIAGMILLLIISYTLAFKRTITAWQRHRQLIRELAASADVSQQPAYLERKARNLDHILKAYELDSVVFRNNAVNSIALLAEKEQVKLLAIPVDEAIYHTPHTILQKMVFEGDFFSLLKLTDQLQKKAGIGVLRSVAWSARLRYNGADDPKKVDLEVYLEIYR